MPHPEPRLGRAAVRAAVLFSPEPEHRRADGLDVVWVVAARAVGVQVGI